MGKQSRLRALRKQVRETAKAQGVPVHVYAGAIYADASKKKTGIEWAKSVPNKGLEDAKQALRSCAKRKI